MSYAEGTTVDQYRTQAEIRKTLAKYKATGFAIGENLNKATVMFEMNGRRIRFAFEIPVKGKLRDGRGSVASQKQVDQEIRRLWRCLLLSIKSKLECVDSKISTFEEEFLSHIVLPDGRTMGDLAIPQIKTSYERNEMPPLLGYKS